MGEHIRVYGTLRSLEDEAQEEALSGSERIKKLEERVQLLKDSLQRLEIFEDLIEKKETIQTLRKIESKGRLLPVFQVIYERIQEETNYFHHLVETGLYFDLVAGRLLRADFGSLPPADIAGIRVEWGAKLPWEDRDAWAMAISSKIGQSQVKFTDKKPGSPLELLMSIAVSGRIPQSLQGIQHELVHILQFQNVRRHLGDLLKVEKGERDDTLAEVHARRADGILSGVEFSEDAAAKHLLKVGIVHGGKRDDFLLSRLTAAVRAVDVLHALGVSNSEIGQIICGEDGWDSTNGKFPKIEIEINRIRGEKNIRENEVGLLLWAYQLERQIAMLRAKFIAYEELNKCEARLNG